MFHWLSKDVVRFKIEVGFAKYLQNLFQAPIVAYLATAARYPGCHEIKSPIGKSPRDELRDDISPPAAILLSYNIRRGANMFLPPRNKGFDDDNTLHVQSGVTVLTDTDFSEGRLYS